MDAHRTARPLCAGDFPLSLFAVDDGSPAATAHKRFRERRGERGGEGGSAEKQRGPAATAPSNVYGRRSRLTSGTVTAGPTWKCACRLARALLDDFDRAAADFLNFWPSLISFTFGP